jgi:hypothetical protein
MLIDHKGQAGKLGCLEAGRRGFPVLESPSFSASVFTPSSLSRLLALKLPSLLAFQLYCATILAREGFFQVFVKIYRDRHIGHFDLAGDDFFFDIF